MIRTSIENNTKTVHSLSAALLANNSLSTVSPRSSQISLSNETFGEYILQHTEDRNWSWGYLRKRFRIEKLEELYDRYIKRLQNAYFNAYLFLQVVLSILYICLLLFFNFGINNSTKVNTNLATVLPEVISQGIIATISLIILSLVWDEKRFCKYPQLSLVTSVFVAGLLLASDICLSIFYYYNDEEKPIRTPAAFQLLIIIYFFLPIPTKIQAVTLGSLVSLTHLLTGIILCSKETNWVPLVIVDFIYYLCGNAIGVYSQFLREVTLRRAFIDRRDCIRSTIKKNLEKDKQDHLLLSILPHHISEKVKGELLTALQVSKQQRSSNSSSHLGIIHKKPFSDLFMERHNNVTILFADVVNFTQLTCKLGTAEELVECLNELFGRFDSAARRYDCLRIKLLGDCYYCVSGLPNSTPAHAKNCVELGLSMIEIIKTVRDKYKVDVSMRIGIHSGSILSGLLGIYKWQYDIWSKDVTIANHMEKTGKPGLVHVTKATRDFLGDEYTFKLGHGQHRDTYLEENNVETFFITPPLTRCSIATEEYDSDDDMVKPFFSNSPNMRRNASRSSSPSISRTVERRSKLSGVDLEVHINTFRNVLLKVDEHMIKAIDDMPLTRANLCCRRSSSNCKSSVTQQERVGSLFMNFERISSELEFQRQPDPLFKFYVTCALFVLLCIGVIHALIMPTLKNVLWAEFVSGLVFLMILAPTLWTAFLWGRFKDPHRDSSDTIPKPNNVIVRRLYNFSFLVTKSWILRTALYIIISQLISTLAIIDVMECDKNEQVNSAKNKIPLQCVDPWCFTYSCGLAFVVMYSFFRVHFLLKFITSVASLTGYGVAIFFARENVFNQLGSSPAFSSNTAAKYSHIIYLVNIILLLHVIDRQMEYITRLDFIWKKKLKEENKEASTTHEINTILIHNILPLEIASIYLHPNRVGEGHSRSYDNIAVMFASIPNFMDCFAVKDLDDQDHCLRILNEIIVEFDQALPEHVDVEKIKVVGSTYMAACGLEVQGTGRLSSLSAPSLTDVKYSNDGDATQINDSVLKGRKTIVTLVRYAASLMVRLQTVNKDAFQDFQLRVGIACGPVIAGVIGAEKPLYDIWGDTVNVSSRMDSTGIPGKIQVSEESAKCLKQAGVKCECRGLIPVKGKGHLTTYFVKLNDEHQIIMSYEDDEHLNLEYVC